MFASPRKLSALLVCLAVIGVTGCSKEGRKARYLERANRDFAAQQYEKAELEYLNLLKVSPLHPVAVRRLGIIYHDQGRLPQAYAYLQKAAELEPANIDAQVNLGLCALSVRKIKEARAQALKVLEIQPDQEEALLLLVETSNTSKEMQEARQRIETFQQRADKGQYHLALGLMDLRQQDLGKAETRLKKAAVMIPESSAVHVALGNLYWSQKDLPLAEKEFLTASSLSPLRSSHQLKYPEFKFQTGAAAEAKKTLEAIIKTTPDFLAAYVQLIQIQFSEKKYDECGDLVKKVLDRDAVNFDALMMSGNLHLAKGEPAKAVEVFENMSRLYEGAPHVLFQLAVANLRNGDTTKAIRFLNQALVKDPNLAEAIILLAEINLRQGNSVPAVTALTQLLAKRPDLPKAQMLLATAYLSQKNLDASLTIYRNLATLSPKDSQLHLLMGIILMQQDKRPEARKAFEKSLEISPGSFQPLEQLVGLDLAEKKYEAALKRVQERIEKAPSVAEPHLLLAKIHMARNETDLAEKTLQRAIELKPDLGMAYMMLAQIYVTSNQHQQALDRLTRLVSKTNYVPALMQIGIIHQQLNDYPRAADAYEKLLAINPKFTPAVNNLAYLDSEHLHRLDQARELAEKARQMLPYDPYTADTLGWVLFKKGDYARALSLLQESAEKLGDHPEVQFHLGMAHYKLGEEQFAMAALKKSVDAKKDFPGAQEAKRRLDVLRVEPVANATVQAALEKNLKEEPDDLIVLGKLAAVYEKSGAPEKAAKAYETVLKKNPKNAAAMIQMAELFARRLNNPSRALELAKDAHNLDPEDAYISASLGRMVYQSGDYKRALSLFQEAYRKAPDEAGLRYDLAWAYYSVGRLVDAESTMRTAVQQTTSRSEESKRFLAMIDYYKNPARAKAATAEIRQVLKSDPAYVPGLMANAAVCEQEGNFNEAKNIYEAVLSRNPLFTPASRDLAILYAERFGDDSKAYPLAVKAREMYPQDEELAKALGCLAYRRGEYARAAQLLKESAPKRKEDSELMFYLGMSHYRLKERTESKAALQRALSLNVATKLADQARQVLAELK